MNDTSDFRFSWGKQAKSANKMSLDPLTNLVKLSLYKQNSRGLLVHGCFVY